MVMIVTIIFFTFTKGEVNEDMEIMKKMIMDIKEITMVMNQRLLDSEKALEAVTSALAITKDNFANALKDPATREEAVITNSNLAITKGDLDKKYQNFEIEVTKLRNPPYLNLCGYQYYTKISSGTIPYSYLLCNSTNIKGGGLDTDSGVFTAPISGTYTLTWALFTDNMSGEHGVDIYLHRNGRIVEESLLCTGWVEQGKIKFQLRKTLATIYSLIDSVILARTINGIL